MIANMLSNKKHNPIVTESFIIGRKLNISLFFVTQSYYAVPKTIRLDSTCYLIMKITNKWELKQIAFSHSSDIDFKDFINLYKKCAAKPYFLMLLLRQIIFYVSERIFRKNIKTNQDNLWSD